MGFVCEIFLTEKNVTEKLWHEFIDKVSTYNGLFRSWKIMITFERNTVHYYSKTHCSLPPSINGLKSFMLKKTVIDEDENKSFYIPLLMEIGSNAIDIKNHFDFRGEEVKEIEITIKKISDAKSLNRIIVSTEKNGGQKRRYKMLLGIPSLVLNIDFSSNYGLSYKGAPKYLDMSKSLHILNTNKVNSILSVYTYPYLQGDFYLSQNNVDFAKHSLVLGASGCGKSKFISLLVENIYKTDEFKNNYKVVIIDPHAALEDDIGGLGKNINFATIEDSINLFSNDCKDAIVSVELLLDVFKSLIPNNYNSKLERVLRHSIYLLLIDEHFDFKTLRKLLLDMDFRNSLIKKRTTCLPYSIVEFFLTEFNEIKTRSYTEAISPIIAFIDEMEMIPVFDREQPDEGLKNVIDKNFLTIISLDRTKIGDKVTKAVSGLVMEQLLTLVQNRSFKEHIILIVDEVAVVENPILKRFLAEARKYDLSLILAGQYFGGISEELKKSIYANVINYYIFRVSKGDAEVLVKNLNIKIPLDNTDEQKVKLLTELQNRQAIVRISSFGNILPAIKCKTLDFQSTPRIKSRTTVEKQRDEEKQKGTLFKEFSMSSTKSLKDILKANSTSRKVVR